MMTEEEYNEKEDVLDEVDWDEEEWGDELDDLGEDDDF